MTSLGESLKSVVTNFLVTFLLKCTFTFYWATFYSNDVNTQPPTLRGTCFQNPKHVSRFSKLTYYLFNFYHCCCCCYINHWCCCCYSNHWCCYVTYWWWCYINHWRCYIIHWCCCYINHRCCYIIHWCCYYNVVVTLIIEVVVITLTLLFH